MIKKLPFCLTLWWVFVCLLFPAGLAKLSIIDESAYAFNVAIMGGSSPGGVACSEPIHEDDFNDGTLDAWSLSSGATNPGTTLLLTYDAIEDNLVQQSDLPGEPITEFSVQFSLILNNAAGTYSSNTYSPVIDQDAGTTLYLAMRSAVDGASVDGFRVWYNVDSGVSYSDTIGDEVEEGVTYYLGVYRKRSTGPGDDNGIIRIWQETDPTKVGVLEEAIYNVTTIDDDEQIGLVQVELGGSAGDGFYDGSNTYTLEYDNFKLRSNEECFD